MQVQYGLKANLLTMETEGTQTYYITNSTGYTVAPFTNNYYLSPQPAPCAAAGPAAQHSVLLPVRRHNATMSGRQCTCMHGAADDSSAITLGSASSMVR